MSEDRSRTPQFSFGGDHDPRPDTQEPVRRRTPLVAATVVIVLIAAGGGYYYFYPDRVQSMLQSTPLELSPTVTHAYKWQDASGAWHITQKPPPEGVRYEKLSVRNDTNILPAQEKQ